MLLLLLPPAACHHIRLDVAGLQGAVRSRWSIFLANNWILSKHLQGDAGPAVASPSLCSHKFR